MNFIGDRYYNLIILFMEDFKERMCQEHSELSDRLGKLNVALCKDGFREKVGDYQFKLMKEQALGMEKYYLALTARLVDMGLFPNDEGKSFAFAGMGIAGAVNALKLGLAVRRKGWNGKGLFVVKQIPSHITSDIIPKMQSLPQSAKNILMSRENPHIDYINQMLIINPDGRADSWVPSVSDIFADDWEIAND